MLNREYYTQKSENQETTPTHTISFHELVNKHHKKGYENYFANFLYHHDEVTPAILLGLLSQFTIKSGTAGDHLTQTAGISEKQIEIKRKYLTDIDGKAEDFYQKAEKTSTNPYEIMQGLRNPFDYPVVNRTHGPGYNITKHPISEYTFKSGKDNSPDALAQQLYLMQHVFTKDQVAIASFILESPATVKLIAKNLKYITNPVLDEQGNMTAAYWKTKDELQTIIAILMGLISKLGDNARQSIVARYLMLFPNVELIEKPETKEIADLYPLHDDGKNGCTWICNGVVRWDLYKEVLDISYHSFTTNDLTLLDPEVVAILQETQQEKAGSPVSLHAILEKFAPILESYNPNNADTQKTIVKRSNSNTYDVMYSNINTEHRTRLDILQGKDSHTKSIIRSILQALKDYLSNPAFDAKLIIQTNHPTYQLYKKIAATKSLKSYNVSEQNENSNPLSKDTQKVINFIQQTLRHIEDISRSDLHSLVGILKQITVTKKDEKKDTVSYEIPDKYEYTLPQSKNDQEKFHERMGNLDYVRVPVPKESKNKKVWRTNKIQNIQNYSLATIQSIADDVTFSILSDLPDYIPKIEQNKLYITSMKTIFAVGLWTTLGLTFGPEILKQIKNTIPLSFSTLQLHRLQQAPQSSFSMAEFTPKNAARPLLGHSHELTTKNIRTNDEVLVPHISGLRDGNDVYRSLVEVVSDTEATVIRLRQRNPKIFSIKPHRALTEVPIPARARLVAIYTESKAEDKSTPYAVYRDPNTHETLNISLGSSETSQFTFVYEDTSQYSFQDDMELATLPSPSTESQIQLRANEIKPFLSEQFRLPLDSTEQEVRSYWSSLVGNGREGISQELANTITDIHLQYKKDNNSTNAARKLYSTLVQFEYNFSQIPSSNQNEHTYSDEAALRLAIIEEDGGICADYALISSFILNKMGISSFIITGYNDTDKTTGKISNLGHAVTGYLDEHNQVHFRDYTPSQGRGVAVLEAARKNKTDEKDDTLIPKGLAVITIIASIALRDKLKNAILIPIVKLSQKIKITKEKSRKDDKALEPLDPLKQVYTMKMDYISQRPRQMENLNTLCSLYFIMKNYYQNQSVPDIISQTLKNHIETTSLNQQSTPQNRYTHLYKTLFAAKNNLFYTLDENGNNT
jgi:hypothetical protein